MIVLEPCDEFERLLGSVGSTNFDELGGELSFVTRLARDNGWSDEFAAPVVEEYKKFVVLVITSEKELTSSDSVDQAWHLHLLYTLHNWGEWTNHLGKKLHDGPTFGGAAERQRYLQNYRNTLGLYQNYFGHVHNRSIWPSEHIRFDNTNSYVRLDTSKYIMSISSGIEH